MSDVLSTSPKFKVDLSMTTSPICVFTDVTALVSIVGLLIKSL